MTNKTFTKAQELDLLIDLRCAYEAAIRAYYCNIDFHREYFKEKVGELKMKLDDLYNESVTIN